MLWYPTTVEPAEDASQLQPAIELIPFHFFITTSITVIFMAHSLSHTHFTKLWYLHSAQWQHILATSYKGKKWTKSKARQLRCKHCKVDDDLEWCKAGYPIAYTDAETESVLSNDLLVNSISKGSHEGWAQWLKISTRHLQNTFKCVLFIKLYVLHAKCDFSWCSSLPG